MSRWGRPGGKTEPTGLPRQRGRCRRDTTSLKVGCEQERLDRTRAWRGPSQPSVRPTHLGTAGCAGISAEVRAPAAHPTRRKIAAGVKPPLGGCAHPDQALSARLAVGAGRCRGRVRAVQRGCATAGARTPGTGCARDWTHPRVRALPGRTPRQLASTKHQEPSCAPTRHRWK